MLPPEGSGDMAALHAARTYCLLAVGCPPRSSGSRADGLKTADLLRMLANTLRCGLCRALRRPV